MESLLRMLRVLWCETLAQKLLTLKLQDTLFEAVRWKGPSISP